MAPGDSSSDRLPRDVDEARDLLAGGDYVAGRDLATVVLLALRMHKPLLLEGEAGVGKTELAKVLARVLDRDLIRLQCYEGLDLSNAAYEWNYPRQMVAIRLAEAEGAGIGETLYSREFLIDRPLLQALEAHAKGPPVLLIDEIDRADEPFEAFLLEFLSDFQLSIPELGTLRATEPPIVVITSNRTREVHDALRRRCLYHWVAYPDAATESRIVALKAPEAAGKLCEQLVAFVQRLRRQDLHKAPGVAETIDWARALTELDTAELTTDAAGDTLGLLLKYQDDLARLQGAGVAEIIAGIHAELRDATEPGQRQEGLLAGNVLRFCRSLRQAGLPLGPGAVVDALAAARLAGLERPDDLYHALRATLVKDAAHFAVFDSLFQLCFRRPDLLQALAALHGPEGPRDEAPGTPETLRGRPVDAPCASADAGTGSSEAGVDRSRTGSSLEILRDKDFARMSAAELRQAQALMRREIPLLAARYTRRFRPDPVGHRYDLRRSMQLMVRTNGQLLTLARKRRRLQRPMVVLLCDISGSMSAYSRVFLQFAHALAAAHRRLHTFVFGTRLTNITRQLAARDADSALAAAASQVDDWDGGTRIAASLERFNLDWVRRLPAHGAVVLLLTDGLERDSPDNLARQMQRLRRSCRTLIWLNPVLRYPEFKPLATGIRAMLPHADRFLPAHNLQSVVQLMGVLTDRRPAAPVHPGAAMTSAGRIRGVA